MPMHICEPALDSVVLKGQGFVVEAEEMEDGGVEVVDGEDVFHGLASEFVGDAVAESTPHAGTGEPAGKAVGIVITTLRAFLKHRHATEFSTPDDEGVLKQTALLEVAHEGGGWLVQDGGMFVVLFFQFV